MHRPNKQPAKLSSESFLHLASAIDYELIDCGGRRKLERFGKYIVDRPEFEANWPRSLGKQIWARADWHFYEEKGKKGTWTNNTGASDEWKIDYKYQDVELQFDLKITAFKHLGIFPEQAENWKFIQRELLKYKGEIKVLNLFAYTGAASIVAAKCGAQVTNVDSVKQVLNWGRQNAENNSVENIRWILEDARKFVAKAVRRGDKFQGIIMDPPAFGLGANRETWKIENDLQALLSEVGEIVHPKKHFFIINTYSPKLSLKKLETILKKNDRFYNKFTATTLGLKSSTGVQLSLGNLIRY